MLGILLQRLREAKGPVTRKRLSALCIRLLSEAGAANSAAIAADVLEAYSDLDAEGRLDFFQYLDRDLGPNRETVLKATSDYAEMATPERVLALQRAVEPPRQELLRRINRATGGVAAIVAMRRDLLKLLRNHRGLRAVDADFVHLLRSWFNPGFLILRQVDWNSPAALLEKIVQYEAVHAVRDWQDLKRRLQADRRCFAFFHPQLPEEPLIFVEVALVNAIPRSIEQLIGEGSGRQPFARPTVAAFYSISNCEPALKNISLGNFLIKRVAEQLRAELASVRRFCTLSPVPGLVTWFANVEEAGLPRAARSLRARYRGNLEALSADIGRGAVSAEEQRSLAQCAAVYLTRDIATDAGDPVARFHLDNGARLERVNPGADLSEKGLRLSLGVMVNYLYDLTVVEANHERFIRGEVVRSRKIAALCHGA